MLKGNDSTRIVLQLYGSSCRLLAGIAPLLLVLAYCPGKPMNSLTKEYMVNGRVDIYIYIFVLSLLLHAFTTVVYSTALC